MSSNNSNLISLLFDKKLIEMGNWSKDDLQQIEKWNEIGDYEKQKNVAARLVSYLTLDKLNRDCDTAGRVRIRRLAAILDNFETMLILTRSIEGKFYRDHLNHIIRVALLARAIGIRQPFNLSKEDLDKLTLACVFHDIAYPLSQLHKILGSTVNAIKNCYNIARTMETLEDLSLNIDKNIIKTILPAYTEIIEKKLIGYDHGLLSAFEFLTYLKDPDNIIQKYSEVIKAIALHSPPFNMKIDAKSDKLLAILIIADELQDWGRPTTYGLSPFSKINSFQICNNVIEGIFTTSRDTNFSVLRQAYGKYQNISRITIPTDFKFRIEFPLRDFQQCSLMKFEESLQTVFNICIQHEKKLFDPKSFINLYRSDSPAEEIYYGIKIPSKYKLNTYKFLINQIKSSNVSFNEFYLFVNNSTQESLVTPSKIKEITSLNFISNNGLIKLYLLNGVNENKGILQSMNDVPDLAFHLIAEIRFFNICIQKLSKFKDKKYPIHLGIEEFPNDREIFDIMSDLEIEYDDQIFHYLPNISYSISNHGFFAFQETRSTASVE